MDSVLIFFCRQRYNRISRILEDDGKKKQRYRHGGGNQRSIQVSLSIKTVTIAEISVVRSWPYEILIVTQAGFKSWL